MSARVFIERDDFKEVHDKSKEDFRGLSPAQAVHLKYGPVLKLVSIEKKPDGSIDYLKVEANENLSSEEIAKVPGHIHWVSKDSAMTVICNLYTLLFTKDNPLELGDNWTDCVNPNSLTVRDNAKIWDLHKKIKVEDRFQFERMGYFMLDRDSNPKKKKFVFNRIVELRESKDKK